MARIIRNDPYLTREDTGADEGRTPAVQHYEKQDGSDGATSNTVFTLSNPYVQGSNTLLVFVNGQKAELLVSATDETEYEETSSSTVTFGASLLDTDVVEFIIVGTYFIQDTDIYVTKSLEKNKNLLNNGDMRIAQRGTSATTVTASQFLIDRWEYRDGGTTAAVVTLSQDTDVPTGEGFANSFKIDVTTAESGSDADELITVAQRTEGQNLQHLEYGDSSAKSVTISFWFKSDNKTGTLCTCLEQDDASKFYITEHTVSDNNWNKYTVTIPGDSAGTINNDNGSGLSLFLVLVAGSAYHASADTWGSGTDFATSNQTNFLDNTSNNLWFTGIQLEVNDEATPFEFKPIDKELARCQRYYFRSTGYQAYVGQAYAANDTVYNAPLCFPVTMRALPTMGYSALSDWELWEAGTSDEVLTTFNTYRMNNNMAALRGISTTATLVNGDAGTIICNDNTNGYIDFDAEL